MWHGQTQSPMYFGLKSFFLEFEIISAFDIFISIPLITLFFISHADFDKYRSKQRHRQGKSENRVFLSI